MSDYTHMRKSNYGITETIKNLIFIILTKLFFRNARLIRLPITIRGKKFIKLGRNFTTGFRCRIEVNGLHSEKVLIIGSNVNIGDDVRISCARSIIIGNNVLIGSKVLIIDNAHGSYSGLNQDAPEIPPNKRELTCSPTIIGDNVWVGEGVVILKGCTIGSGCIIGANAVVTRSFPEKCIIGGVPATILKKYDYLSSKWENI